MKQDILLLMAVSLAMALAIATAAGDADAGQRRSRFLLPVKKCLIDLHCIYPGSPGPTCCGSSCVNRLTSAFNCGKCGKTCKFTQTCCSGKCKDLSFDKNNCGLCDNKCKKNCVYGLCDYV